MKAPSVLVVGQGIAGSLLTWFLLQSGAEVKVADAAKTHTASRIANGLVNPVTGRRYALSWRYEPLQQAALSAYRDLEALLNLRFYREVDLFKLLPDVRALNDWSVRAGSEGFEHYMAENDLLKSHPGLNCRQGFFRIYRAWQLETRVFLDAFRRFLISQNRWIETTLHYREIMPDQEKVTYRGEEYDYVVFCEGASVTDNPWFKDLPFAINKGECLEIGIQGFEAPGVLNGEGILSPFPNRPERFYAGSTYFNEYLNDLPSKEGRTEVEDKIKQFLTLPYQVLEHFAALRPSTFDRRPMLGLHPVHSTLGIFNGMGTKGVSLAPYFAQHFTRHLILHEPLQPEVDIKRFNPQNS